MTHGRSFQTLLAVLGRWRTPWFDNPKAARQLIVGGAKYEELLNLLLVKLINIVLLALSVTAHYEQHEDVNYVAADDSIPVEVVAHDLVVDSA